MSKKFKYNYFPNSNNDEFRLFKEQGGDNRV